MRDKNNPYQSIGIFITPDSRSIKAIRDKISGVLRNAAEHPNWAVRIVELPSDGTLPTERLDGAIILARTPSRCTRLVRSYVAVDPIPHQKGEVAIDDAQIGRTAAEFLLKRGYRSLAFVGSSKPGLVKHSRGRSAAFLAAARKANAATAVLESDTSASSFIKGLEDLSNFVKGLEKPCGILACADEVAKDVLDACRLAHITVPDQIALIGVDNEIEICENTHPSLTSIRPDFERCGYMASKILSRALRDGKTHPTGTYIYGAREIVERASTLDLRGGGRLVSSAMEIIRRESIEGLTVGVLAKRLNTSSRLLEIRFREILGKTVKESILETRLERVHTLLRDTDVPIEDISAKCGWRTPIALKVLFVRRYGMSMREYRKRKPLR